MLNKTYYPGLNELRALAVLSIIPGHIEQIKSIFNLPFFYWFPIPGKLGVILFFVISGFLITTLLLKERSTTSTINLKNFYVKRILRIWPLYFLIMALSILFINKLDIFQMPIYSSLLYEKIDTNNNIMLLLLVMPNYMNVMVPYAAQTWSIGIEEQFYLIQPFIVKIIKRLWALILFMLLIVFLKEILYGFDLVKNWEIVKIVRPWSSYFGSIAIGSIGAILCHSYPKFVERVIYNKILQLITFLTFIAFLITIWLSHKENIIDFRFHAILFVIIVINASTNPLSFYNLNNKFLDYLGRISYGMYIYHIIAIVMAIKFSEYLSGFFENNQIIFNISVYSLTMILTIGISVLSYQYFEKWFLGFKRNFHTQL
ncbi:MAG: acyltransferase [Bacteroidales bacterium]|nr:acyltransferase [Bacteroidales bacterium]